MLPLFYCAYINVKSSNDILGTELAAILKTSMLLLREFVTVLVMEIIF